MKQFGVLITALIILTLLTACGGGGGGGGTPNQPPTANAGSGQIVNEQTFVTLAGSGTDIDGTIVGFSWLQTGGTTVTLNNSLTATPDFTSPIEIADETLTFQLTVTDNQGATGTDSVNIDVINTEKLNDTGIITCADIGINNLPCPVINFPNQDAENGNDASFLAGSLVKVGGGLAGFDFTKLDASGNPLSASAVNWSCVRDNQTDLEWEIKTIGTGILDASNTYSWYNSDVNSNGGNAGLQNGGGCNSTSCDTAAYVNAINSQSLCGVNDWRMPTQKELRSIVDYAIAEPAASIDSNYFPNTLGDFYWSSSANANNANFAWAIRFTRGDSVLGDKSNDAYRIRLVRNSQ